MGKVMIIKIKKPPSSIRGLVESYAFITPQPAIPRRVARQRCPLPFHRLEVKIRI